MIEELLPELILTALNVGIITGIFFRMGGFTEFKRSVERRLEQLERKEPTE